MPIFRISKKYLRAVPYIAVAAIFFSLGGGAVYYYEQHYAPKPEPQIIGIANFEEGKPASVDFKIFWETWAAIQQKYVGRNNLDFQSMVFGAAKGLVQSLGDPYSNFFTPKESQDFETTISGRFGGIGIEIGLSKGILTVIAPIEGTPAKQAGLKAGDQIVKIEGKDTIGMTLDQAVNLIRGKPGTQVTLTIFRASFSQPKDFVITRDTINVPSVSWKPIDNDIARIQIYNFNENSFWEFEQAAIQVYSSGRKHIILDLRDNPGGFLESAIDIGGWFVPKGIPVVEENEGSGPFVCNICKASGNSIFKDYKTVVLVNGGSASASEILAGALRDDLGVKLVGEKTFGKGSVQELENLRGGAAIKITVAHWLTPRGTDINEKGLAPDVMVSNPSNGNKDLQLEKAIEVVRSL